MILDRMLVELPFTANELRKIVRTASYRYKTYSIKKRSGEGKRIISQPSPEVKLIQRWLCANILQEFPVHRAASAYVAGRSIAHNARLHADSRYLLKLDFTDFFPSLRAADFIKHTEKYAPTFLPDIGDLLGLLFRKTKTDRTPFLAIGAPSSPMVSNTILYDFDKQLSEYCLAFGVTYSRYADDIVFSTNIPDTLTGVQEHVVGLLRSISYPRLALNRSKTVFTSKKFNRTVTGLVISNSGDITVGRDKKRLIRSLLHKLSIGQLSGTDTEWLSGYLAFLKDVEPQHWRKIRQRMRPEMIPILRMGQSTGQGI